MDKFGLKAIPTFRIRDYHKAIEFYISSLGFGIDWEHRFTPDAPVYMQVSKGDLILHLTENERFQSGVIVFIETKGIDFLRNELKEKSAQIFEIALTDWGTKQMEIEDPFGNLMRFNESMAYRKHI
jgi:uncharacterized glyoxalase superfamily protein PhnB